MHHQDRTLGIVATLLGLYVFISGLNLPHAKLEGDLGAGLFPILIGLGIVICGLLLMIPREKSNSEKEQPAQQQKQNLRKGLILMALLVAYPVSLKWLGFFITNFCFLSASGILIASNKSRRTNIYIVLASVATTTVLLYIFQNLLYVMLPEGILFKYY